MFKYFRLLCFCFGLCICNANHASNLVDNNELVNMPCRDLMLELIKTSSFNDKFMDKSMALEFYFERSDDRYIGLTFARTSGPGKGVIYGNFQLDLIARTLKYIDPDPAVSIEINKNYVPLIAEKCTPDQNLYGDTGRLPTKEFDGGE